MTIGRIEGLLYDKCYGERKGLCYALFKGLRTSRIDNELRQCVVEMSSGHIVDVLASLIGRVVHKKTEMRPLRQ